MKIPAIFRSAAVLAAAMSAICCNRDYQEPSAEFSQWIEAYTGGIIEEGSTIKVVLTCDAADNLGTDPGKAFSFSPDIRGNVRISDRKTVEFIPDDGALKPGTCYKASFRLSDFADGTGPGCDIFRFSFRTVERTAELDIEGVRITSENPLEAVILGRAVFSTATDAGTVKEMLSCRLPGQDPQVSVSGTGSGTSFQFRITGIRRLAKDTEAGIVFNGEAGGFRTTDEPAAMIPGTEELFDVTDARAVYGDSPYIDLWFSHPLDESMDTDGLIELENAGRTYVRLQDNNARVFFEKAGEDGIRLRVDPALKSADGLRLGTEYSRTFKNDEPKPAVQLLLTGNILPDASDLILPFKAVNLYAVDLSVIRIYEDNVLSFLQENDMDGDSGLRRAGRLVARKTIRLDTDPGRNLHEWQDFAVDISGLFRKEPGAIYRIRISFRQEYSLYGNPDGNGSMHDRGLVTIGQDGVTEEDETVWDTPYPYYYESFYSDGYVWKERDNPLHPTYYMLANRFPVCNLMSTGIGIIAKSSGDGRLWIAVNDILTAKPLKDADVTVYNYQLRTVGKAKTDANGFAEIRTEGKAFAVTASYDGETTYLKVNDGSEIPLSRFDTGGIRTENGIKAFIYGERGVWRPGDTLHVTMIVEDRDNPLPDSHPVTMELYTPQGQFHTRQTDTEGVDGFHVFHIETSPDDPTGTWNAYFKLGGSTFHKALMIESVKPNRLKIDLRTDREILAGGEDARFDLSASWLTGPAAAGLDCKVEMSLTPAGKTFPQYEGYTFSDPTSSFSGTETMLFDKALDNSGRLSSTVRMPSLSKAPGMLQARLISRVAESGGDESITSRTMLFSPYDAYVGIKFPSSEDGYIETDTTHRFHVVVTGADGKPLKGRHLEYKIFRLDWSWWWESRAEELDSYVNGTAAEPYSSGTLVSSEKGCEIPFRLDYPEWGRFLVYVRDLSGGHATGGIIMVDWPAYRGRSDKKDPDALSVLTFSTDRKEYVPGETATVFVPATEDGVALVSLENGSRVISRNWVRTSGEKDTPFRFTVTEEMAPNIYVHISLLQKHGRTSNDLPVRLYGVQPISVTDKESRLQPEISMPESVRPLEEFTIRISEKNGRDMTYTLAIVDEGLLDLTAFRTPDPWSSMYAREALGVKTWDMYDDVIGAFGGRFAAISAIGGDQTINKESKIDNRFNAVVKFLGPFTLSGKSDVHRITLPMYVGSVRVMLVAGKDGTYGNAEKTVPVKTPLMVLSTLPRTLSCGDEIVLPVNVFAMEDGIENVSVSVRTEGPVRLVGPDETTLAFDTAGDRLVRFRLAATSDSGTAGITVTATGGGYTAQETVSVPVRNPNPVITSTMTAMVNPGEHHTFEWTPSGASYRAGIGLTGFPSIDFNSCFRFANEYRHDCTEQLAARGLTLLAVSGLVSEDNAEKAADLIPSLLTELYGRQLPDGGFAYWPGRAEANEWATSMAGHFMTLASERGYDVSSGVYAAWKNFQRQCARNWRQSRENDLSDLVQAYRLYTLALSGAAETGAMNRMREAEGLSLQAKWRLAACYAISGKKNIASDMVQSLKTDVSDYSVSNVTYGTPLRDKAMILETLILTDDISGAIRLAGDVAEEFTGTGRYTTQSTAFTAIAMGRLARTLNTGAIEADIVQDRKETVRIRKAASAATAPLDGKAGSATVKNLSDGPLYAAVSLSGQPDSGASVPASSSGIEVNISWTDLDGNPIRKEKIRQGTDFLAAVSVSDITGMDNLTGLALTFTVPSGWEIFNDRFIGGGSEDMPDGNAYSYMDIRDDMVCIYFDLPKGTRKKFRIRLRAAYEGSFILPAVTCEAMYDPSVNASTASGKVSVTD